MDYTKIPRFSFLPLYLDWQSVNDNLPAGKGMSVKCLRDYMPTPKIGKGLKRGEVTAKITKVRANKEYNKTTEATFNVHLFTGNGVGKAWQVYDGKMTRSMVFPLEGDFLSNRKIGYKDTWQGSSYAECYGNKVRVISIPSFVKRRDHLERLRLSDLTNPEEWVVVKTIVELTIEDLRHPENLEAYNVVLGNR